MIEKTTLLAVPALAKRNTGNYECTVQVTRGRVMKLLPFGAVGGNLVSTREAQFPASPRQNP
jgi:hypothetical protein